jgi:predicted outer membrane repeat protein
MAPRTLLLVLGLLLAVPAPAYAATIRVPADQPTIQAGINAAFPGDTVLVAAGTYTGTGNKNLDLLGKAIVLRSVDGSDSTIIDCEGQGRAFYFQAGEVASTVVDGFTLRNGLVTGLFPDSWGGGILCLSSSPTVTNCKITGNSSQNGWGGGIACFDSSPVLSDCIIAQNSGLGGGIYAQSVSALHLTGCTISENLGSGVWVAVNSSMVLMECLISGNDGAGVHCDATSTLSVPGCTVMGNLDRGISYAGDAAFAMDGVTFEQNRGALYLSPASPVTISHCDFLGNTSNSIDGGGIYIESGPLVTLADCTFADNDAFHGGGVYVASDSVAITGCTFIENGGTSFEGGGVYIATGSSVAVSGCTFEGNQAGATGGAVHSAGSSQSFVECTFLENTAGRGGAVYSEGASQSFVECIFLENTAGRGAAYSGSAPTFSTCAFITNLTSVGGAIESTGGDGSAIIESCTLYQNVGGGVSVTQGTLIIENTIIAFGSSGGAVSCNGDASANLRCCDLYANLGGDWTGCVDGQLGVNGNIFANPHFCNPAAVDFTIHSVSQCAPANSPAGCGLIGAFPVGCGVADVASGEASGVEARLSVTPNPVRGVADFAFPGVGPRVLAIFDSQGRVVDRLTGNDGRWVWTPGTSAPAGVYFARLDGGGPAGEAVKFLYLR